MTYNKLQNYLLYAYVLTAVFAQYPRVYMINNIFMILFILSSFLTKPRILIKPDSKIFYLYAAIVVISTLDQIYYLTIGEFSYSPHYTTLPMILLLLYAVTRIEINFSFEDFVLANVSILPFLFLLGGFGTVAGRIQTDYLSPNIQGMIVFFGFIVSLQNLVRGKKLIYSLIIFSSSVLFFILSGSRQNMLYTLIGIVFLSISILKQRKFFKRNNFLKKTVILIFITISSSYFISMSINNLSQRFGSSKQLESQASLDVKEHSAAERLSFLLTAIKVSQKYIFGVGQGNTKSAIQRYGNPFFKVTNNSHSLFAELLFSTGFVGLLLWILIVRQLFKLFFNKKYRYQYGYMPFYFIVAGIVAPLVFIKVFWVLIIILERQILKEKRAYNEKNTFN